jgi:hypothetical protein
MRDSDRVQTLQLGWQPAAVLSVALAAGSVLLPTSSKPARIARPYLRESAIVASLYALWQLAGSLSVAGANGAFFRAKGIERFERHWLPSERDAQSLIEGHALLTRGANWYYAGMHFTALGLLLVWLFIRHRENYPRVRNVLVLLTGSSLLIQLIPVAPPRLLPELGFIDTAARYGESVYSISGITVDQLSAMPSVHVGWSLLVAWAVVCISSNRYRWWILLHPTLTVFVVAATANHFWLDGIVAALLLAGSIGVVTLTQRLVHRGPDDGDSRRRRITHLSEGSGHTAEPDRSSDELVGPQHS